MSLQFIAVYTVLLLLLFAVSYSFRFGPRQGRVPHQAVHRFNPLFMAEGDAIDAIRAKMQADPNYNPMTDPSAAAALESLVPDYLKEIPNAIERLNVAFKDATSGADAISDIDSVAASFSNKRDLISSPQSDFFTQGMKTEGSVDEGEVEKLLQRLKQQYPEVPHE